MEKRRTRRKRKNRRLRKLATICLSGVIIVGLGALSIKVYGETNGKDKGEANNEVVELVDPTEVLPGHNLSYAGWDNAVDAKIVEKMLSGEIKSDKKQVFLTFDDGPSPNTESVLNGLKEKGVHGTFFVLGERVDSGNQAEKSIKRIIKEGHAIANHTYTHNFRELYPGNSINIDYFMSEVNKTNNSLKNILGEDFNTRVLRLPGGYNSRVFYRDPSLKAFNERLSNEGIISIDWNALNGDAEGKPYTIEEMMQYVVNSTKDQEQVVILMHDTFGKEKTAQMLPKIIDFYKEKGYEFKTIM